MAGETIKTEAICLDIRPWSQTSHVVAWLTPAGPLSTVVKGAVRPKSAFLGQYDLNYTCEILYYARAKGELHALRECLPLVRRDALRDDYRALAFAGYARFLAGRLAPQGPDCTDWYGLLAATLDAVARGAASPAAVLRFELKVLSLLGLSPEIEAESGAFALRGERRIPVSPAVAALLRDLAAGRDAPPSAPSLDALRALGVYYNFHVDLPSEVRRSVLGVLFQN